MKTLFPYITLLTLAALAGFVIVGLDDARPKQQTVSSSATKGEPAITVINDVVPILNPETEQESLQVSAETTSAVPVETVLSSTTEQADSSPEHCDVSVQVSGLKEKPSRLMVAVFESAGGFPKAESSSSATVVPVEAGTVDFLLKLRTHHPTAIAVFQDLDGDGKLTKSGFGIPVEPYGFSNNARSLLGPPTFSQATFQITESAPSLKIQVR